MPSKKKVKLPLSEGYIVADPMKCAGCIACMLACSLVHEGVTNPSLSRIQVVQSSFRPFPEDIYIQLCHHCANPLCAKACPTGALHIDTAHGNLRLIDESTCDGCRQCVEACPFKPTRIIWNPDKGVCVKCDLCLHAPYWDEQGGPEGKQACVEVCPMRALAFTTKVPSQKGEEGYLVNLRNKHWEWLGFMTSQMGAPERQK